MSITVSLEGITQQYPAPDGDGVLTVVENLDLRYDEPGIHMLLGPSGCGKSTILRMMGGVRPIGVVTPTHGKVLIDGKPCDGPHDDAVMVFQRYNNRPDLSVWNNVAFPFRFALWKDKIPAKERDERIRHMLDSVGLLDKKDHLPSQLSGGQNQRVALARCLVLRPRLLLMDEPFGALDAQTRVEMQALLVKLWKEQQCLIVFVTHDITEALLVGDRITVLSTRPARVAADIAMTEPRPRSDTWLRSTNAIRIEEQILQLLREGHAGATGQVRVSV
jgi:ABC-type nitrate/sulfonate/bicarbonate transport system ATPase subunit